MKSNLGLRPGEGPADDATVKDIHAFTPFNPARETPRAGEDQPKRDASALHALLDLEFTTGQDNEPTAAKTTRFGQPLSPANSRILKSLAGLVILAAVGWMPLQRLLQVSSVEAVVNAQVATLRAPIGGVVAEGQDTIRVGARVARGNILMDVENVRADRGGLDRAVEELQSAKEDLASTIARIDQLEALRADIVSRVEGYRTNRIRRVEAGIAVADAQIRSAQAVVDRASAEVVRQLSLAASGASAEATRQTAERDLAVARAGLDRAKAEKDALVVEANALHAGSFFGDSYDDVPQSVQRLDEIDQNLVSLAADKSKLEARTNRLAAQLGNEQKHFDLASRAKIAAPATGQVWEILTSPGEQVVAGQPLIRLLDCSRLTVTAAVSESVYNTLSIGMPASFSFREGGATVTGQVVQLSGVASAASNFAIIPSALTKESYRVTVSGDNFAGSDTCPVGRTGRVVFGKAGS